jgi:death-on-curing protein
VTRYVNLGEYFWLAEQGAHWDPDPPDTDEAETAMLAIAAHEVDEAWTASWLRTRVNFP